MITVLRARGLRVVIYRHDHEPPHVHVMGDGEVRIKLVGNDGFPELLGSWGMSAGDIRKAMRIVTDEQETLLRLWRQIHG
jgi:hypothetical protein